MSHGNRSKLQRDLWALRNLVEGSANVLRAFVEVYENAPDDSPFGNGLANGHFYDAQEMLIRLDSAILDFVEPSRMAPLDRLACVERARLLDEWRKAMSSQKFFFVSNNPESQVWLDNWTRRVNLVTEVAP